MYNEKDIFDKSLFDRTATVRNLRNIDSQYPTEYTGRISRKSNNRILVLENVVPRILGYDYTPLRYMTFPLNECVVQIF